MKKIFLIALGIIIALLLVVIINTITNSSRQVNVASIEGISVDSQKAAERLSLAIKLQTISHQENEAFIAEPFLQLIINLDD